MEDEIWDNKHINTSLFDIQLTLNPVYPIELLKKKSLFFLENFGTGVQLHELQEHAKTCPVLIEHDVKLSIALRWSQWTFPSSSLIRRSCNTWYMNNRLLLLAV